VQFGQSAVSDLLLDQCPGHHTDHSPALAKTGVGQNSHEADFSAAVHQTDSALRKRLPYTLGGLFINRLRAGTRATKDTDTLQHCSSETKTAGLAPGGL